MELAELAAQLVDAGNAEREALLRENAAQAGVALAYKLKEICQAAWRINPSRSVKAAGALNVLARTNNSAEINALAKWTASIASLVGGQMEQAVSLLDQAEPTLAALGKEYEVAEIQLARSVGLAMLGRYEQAIEAGLQALKVFLAHKDFLAAGKIEHNIGNMYFRRDNYREADEFQARARERFILLDDKKQLASINNCLANTRALLHQFQSAEQLYQQAVQQAEESGVAVTQAEIEGNIGNFALLQGRYDRALDYLERARRRYADLDMPHQSATAEQEIADAYLELNLAPEAIEIYDRVIPTFARLGMRAEQARAVAYRGRAALLAGRLADARDSLSTAIDLYRAEGNDVGGAMALLTQAQLDYQDHNYEAVLNTTSQAEPILRHSGSLRKMLLAQWLRGEALREIGNHEDAEQLLKSAIGQANAAEQPQIAERCYTSRGLLAMAAGNLLLAEAYFKKAIGLTEELRAPLPGTEFRTAFFSDKLVPYSELMRLCLLDGDRRVTEALDYAERARSRALADELGQPLELQATRDEFERKLESELTTLRQELNYLYNQLDNVGQLARLSESEIKSVRSAIAEREQKILKLTRQIQHRRAGKQTQLQTFDLASIQHDLGGDTVLLEFASIDDKLVVFIVNDERVTVRTVATGSTLTDELQQLRFQINTLRHGAERLRRHMPRLIARTVKHLQRIYDLTVRPFANMLDRKRLIIVPHQMLHYLPFQALHDGNGYLVERFEIVYAPSALVWQQCLRRDRRPPQSALLFGVADERTPRVRDEIAALAPLFDRATTRLDSEATLTFLQDNASEADVVHLACHGQFRPDNPLFSSLKLGDGWLNVRDAYELRLNGSLVTLSACETGVNKIAPGDELIGLARGFFAAGAPSLIMSLWTVDDDATAELMTVFYKSLRTTNSASTALRDAQLSVMKSHPHPYFWSPFILVGRQ